MIVDEADPIPTVLGLLILGNKPTDQIPGAWGQFLRLAGTEISSPVIDEAALYDTVADQIRRFEEKLAAHNVRRVRFADVLTEKQHEHYPAEALRQLLRNAYMHRSYEATNAPIRVYW